jgi:hypothetical protein
MYKEDVDEDVLVLSLFSEQSYHKNFNQCMSETTHLYPDA